MMEIGSVRRVRYVLLAVLCVSLTLIVINIYPNIIPKTKTSHITKIINYYRGPQSPPHTNQPKLNIINYNTYPILDEIECVPLKTIPTKPIQVCIHPVNIDIHVSGMLKRHGLWEMIIMNSIKTELAKCPECQFLDVGANVGAFALTVANFGRKVIAVEPLKINLQRLTKSVKLNKMEQTLTIVTNPLSNVYENVTFFQPKVNVGGTHAASANETKTYDAKLYDQVTDPPVPTAKMDDLLQVIDFNKAIMKIDIEGYEPRAFAAADKLFDTVDIRFIYMEWGRKGTEKKSYIQPMLDFMVRRGFKAYDNNFKLLGPSSDVSISHESTAKWPWDIVWVRNLNQ